MAYQPKSYRKYLAGAAAAAVVASAVPTAGFAASSFTDADQIPAYAKDAIDYLVAKEAIGGYPDGSFNPSGEIKRGEAVKILAKALGLTIDADAEASFADLKGHWAAPYVAALDAHNDAIIGGRDADTFDPEANITREELAKIVVIAYDLEANEDVELSFDDVDADSWAAPYINTLSSLGIVGGVSDTEFAPKANVTRAQTPVFVHRTEVEDVRLPVIVDEEEVAVESVSAIDVNKVEVEFNQAVDTDKAKFTLKRGNVVYDATVKFNDDKTAATLETGAKLPAGDYTVTVSGLTEDELTSAVKVETEVAKEIKVSTTSIQYADNNKVAFEVLNQYGTKFSASAADVVANAYNTTANNDVATTIVSSEGNLAVELDNLASEVTTGTTKAHKVGDKVRVTITYKGVTTQATVDVVEVSGAASVSFGQVAPLKDTARITVNNTGLELPYTLLDQYGKEIKFGAHVADTDVRSDIEEFDGVQFTSSAPAVVDVDTFAVNADGKITFNVGAAGTARITALIPSTGQVAYIDVTVNEATQVKTVDVSAPTALVAGGETVKLNLAAVDQYGDAVKSENLGGLTFVSSNQALVADAGVQIDKGQLVVTTKTGVQQAGNVTISVKNGAETVGQVTFEVNPDAEVSSITAVDVTGLFENTGTDTVTYKDIQTKDQYGRVLELTDEVVTVAAKDGNSNAVVITQAVGGTLDSATESVTFTGTAVTGENEVFTFTINGVSKDVTLASVASADIASYKLEAPAVIFGASNNTSASAHAATLTLKGLISGKEVALAGDKVTSYTTSNPSIAEVDNATDEVFGLKAGTVTIAAYNGATKLADTTVTVSEEAPVAASVAFADETKELLNSATYTNVLTVKDQYDVAIQAPVGTFTSSDATVATVDANGLVTAAAAKDGKATIAYITNNGIVKSYEVVVK